MVSRLSPAACSNDAVASTTLQYTHYINKLLQYCCCHKTGCRCQAAGSWDACNRMTPVEEGGFHTPVDGRPPCRRQAVKAHACQTQVALRPAVPCSPFCMHAARVATSVKMPSMTLWPAWQSDDTLAGFCSICWVLYPCLWRCTAGSSLR
jgi:hypothetical protein